MYLLSKKASLGLYLSKKIRRVSAATRKTQRFTPWNQTQTPQKNKGPRHIVDVEILSSGSKGLARSLAKIFWGTFFSFRNLKWSLWRFFFVGVESIQLMETPFSRFFWKPDVDVNHRSKTRSGKLTSQKRWNLAGMDVENLKSHLFICEYPSPKWNTSPQKSNAWKTWLLSWEFPSEGTKVRRLTHKCSRLGLGPWGIPSHRVLSLVWPEGRHHSNSPTLSATLSRSPWSSWSSFPVKPGEMFTQDTVLLIFTPCSSNENLFNPLNVWWGFSLLPSCFVSTKAPSAFSTWGTLRWV